METQKTTLPFQIKHVQHDFVIPSTNKKIKIRGYTVKEEKILLTALESTDVDDMVDSLTQIITNCTHGAIEPSKLTTYDLEMLFITLRAKSVSPEITIPLMSNTCKLKEGNGKCDKPTDVKFNLNDVKLRVGEKNEEFDFKKHKVKKQLMVGDGIGIELRHPSFEEFKLVKNVNDDQLMEVSNTLMAQCITSFFDKENVFPASEYALQAKKDFLFGLDKKTATILDEFFLTVPRLHHECVFKCGHCDKQDSYKIEGLKNFF